MSPYFGTGATSCNKTISETLDELSQYVPEIERPLVKDVLRQYIRTHRRLPPQNFSDWIVFARGHSCELYDYSTIERDLEPFRRYYRGRRALFSDLVQALIESSLVTTQEDIIRDFELLRQGKTPPRRDVVVYAE
ncbi:hypothetical protein HDU93_009614, partial [Gonapodya sp. JEL0774]